MNMSFDELMSLINKVDGLNYSASRNGGYGDNHADLMTVKQVLSMTETPYDILRYIYMNCFFAQQRITDCIHTQEKLYEILLKMDYDWVGKQNPKKASLPIPGGKALNAAYSSNNTAPVRMSIPVTSNSFNSQNRAESVKKAKESLKQNVYIHNLVKVLKEKPTQRHEFSRKESILKSYNYPNDDMKQIRQAVTSANAFYEIFGDEDAIYNSLLAYNDNVGPKEYEELIMDPDLMVTHSVLRQSDVPLALLKEIHESYADDKLVSVLIAWHNNTDSELLHKIITSSKGDKDILEFAYLNANLGEEVMEKLIYSDHFLDRRMIAKNPGLPMNVLLDLLDEDKETDPVVRFNALFNPSTPNVYRNVYRSSDEGCGRTEMLAS